MEKKFQDFSEIERLANSPAGKALTEKIRAKTGSAAENAARAYQSGNYEQAQESLKEIVADPEIRKLIRELGG